VHRVQLSGDRSVETTGRRYGIGCLVGSTWNHRLEIVQLLAFVIDFGMTQLEARIKHRGRSRMMESH
jgi:hypothetical protein